MFKEIEIIEQPVYITKIENDNVLFVYDGYAKSLDGEIYKPVVTEKEDGDCEFLGWEKLKSDF